MTSNRDQRPHVTAYTTGEKVLFLSRQLLLLREALARSAHHAVYYPDLFRALRVLLIDPPPGRLGELAQALVVTHIVHCLRPWEFRPRGKDDVPDADGEARLFRSEIAAILEPADPSRWKQLRGLPEYAPRPSVELDFWEYLDTVIVGIKAEFQAPVSRRSLIADVANSRDVAHADPSGPTYLQAMNALGPLGPHFLVVAQEVALETLTYGRLVLEAAGAKYPDQIRRALMHEFAAPMPVCSTCGQPLAIDAFACPRCQSEQLPPPRFPTLRESLESGFLHSRALNQVTGTQVLILSLEALVASPGFELALVDLAVDDVRMQLYRTADSYLVWRVQRATMAYSVRVLVPSYPKGAANALLILSWSPHSVAVDFGNTKLQSSVDQVEGGQ